MGLKIQQIHYRNFRNYENYELTDIGDVTVFVGPNAIGKTNLVEGIQLITAFNSFRSSKTEHLVRFGEDSSFIRAVLGDGVRKLDIDFTIYEGKRSFSLNGKRKQIKNLRGILPSVVFSPDDLNFIKGSQSIKRAEIDNLGSQLSANYSNVRHVTSVSLSRRIGISRKIQRTRSSRVLMKCSLRSVLSSMYCATRLVQELIPYIKTYYAELCVGKEEVSIAYIPSWLKYEDPSLQELIDSQLSRDEVKEQLDTVIEREFSREHQRRLSLFGPHADQIVFLINGKDASHFASQGQQRSLVLSYKMAEVALLRDRLNQTPVLLLDDVMSELDEQRRTQLIKVISQDIQTFITSTNLSYFDDEFLSNAEIIELTQEGER